MTMRFLCTESVPANTSLVVPGSSPPRGYAAVKGATIDVPGDMSSVDVQFLISARDPGPGGTNYFMLIGPSAATASRPTFPTMGQMLIDTTLNLALWFDGAAWRDCTGTSH